MNIVPYQIKESADFQRSAESSIEIKEYETKLEFLYDVAQQASSAQEVSELLQEIPIIIQKILSASASLLFLVDDEKGQFCLKCAGNGKIKILEEIKLSLDCGIAGWVARNNKPVVIEDVTHDERYDESVDAVSGHDIKQIIAAPLARGARVIGILEMINKDNGISFNERDLGLLTEFTTTEALTLLVSVATTLMNNFKLCQSLQNEYKDTVETLVTFADAKDPYSHGHSRRVKEYSLIAANALQLSPEELKLIEFGALLHDIGKIGIDDRILRKTETLTAEEWYVIRKHTLKGANIVRLIPSLENITDIILHHHERYDGTGYPEGLKGEQIPVGAQIIAVSDAFDTMTTDRAYRAAISIDQAISELDKNSGTQFSPKVVNAFISGINQHQDMLETLVKTQAPSEVLKLDLFSGRVYKSIPGDVEKQPIVAEIVTQKTEETGEKTELTEKQDEQSAAAELLNKLLEEAVAPKSPPDNNQNQPVREKTPTQEFKQAVTQKEIPEAKQIPSALKEMPTRESKKTETQKDNVENRETPPAADKPLKQNGKETREEKNTRKQAEKEAKQAAKRAEEEAKKSRKAKNTSRLNEDISSELFQGEIKLSVTPFLDFKQMDQFKKALLKVKNLTIISRGWSEGDGYTITIWVEEPLSLGPVLQGMPEVKRVSREDKKIIVELKTDGQIIPVEPEGTPP